MVVAGLEVCSARAEPLCLLLVCWGPCLGGRVGGGEGRAAVFGAALLPSPDLALKAERGSSWAGPSAP